MKALIALVALPGIALAADTGGGLAPTPESKWVMDADTGGCLVVRRFGPIKQQVLFGLRQWPGASTAELNVVLPERGNRVPGGDTATILADGATPISKVWLKGWRGLRDGEHQIYARMRVPVADLPKLVAAQSLRVQADNLDITFNTGGMQGLWPSVDKCLTALRGVWQYQPDGTMPAQLPAPLADPDNWIDKFSYPKSALRQGIQGRVPAELDIAADGSVTGCRTLGTPLGGDLEAVTCRLMTHRAQYRPATDASGSPVAGRVVELLSWEIG